MIYANQVSKQIGQQQLLTDVSFFLPAGSYTYLSGVTGSGKTTLLEMIAGSQRPDSGSLVVNEVDMMEVAAERLPFVRRQVGFIASSPSLMENRTAAENVRMRLEIAGFNKQATQERTAATLEQLGLTIIADIAVQKLSADQRWLVSCARAIANKPALVLMDEPPGVSEAAMQRQTDLTQHLSEQGTTVVCVGTAPTANEVDRRIELKQGRAFVDEHKSAVY